MKLSLRENRRKLLVLILAPTPFLLTLITPRSSVAVNFSPFLLLFAVSATIFFSSRRRWPILLAGIGLACWAAATLFWRSSLSDNNILVEPLFPLLPIGYAFLIGGQLLALVLTWLPKKRKNTSAQCQT